MNCWKRKVFYNSISLNCGLNSTFNDFKLYFSNWNKGVIISKLYFIVLFKCVTYDEVKVAGFSFIKFSKYTSLIIKKRKQCVMPQILIMYLHFLCKLFLLLLFDCCRLLKNTFICSFGFLYVNWGLWIS
jgi:hypothetical protein